MNHPFTLEHAANGRAATAVEAEEWLRYVLGDPERAKLRWQELGEISWWLLVLAVRVHPSLRDEVWDALDDNEYPLLSDELKCWLIANACANDGEAREFLHHVVHDVVAAGYREEEAM